MKATVAQHQLLLEETEETKRSLMSEVCVIIVVVCHVQNKNLKQSNESLRRLLEHTKLELSGALARACESEKTNKELQALNIKQAAKLSTLMSNRTEAMDMLHKLAAVLQ